MVAQYITDSDYYPLPEESTMKTEVINGDTKTVTRTMYAVAWEGTDGSIIESVWSHDPRPGSTDTTVIAEFDVTYQSPVDLDFVRPSKAERIAQIKAELEKMGFDIVPVTQHAEVA